MNQREWWRGLPLWLKLVFLFGTLPTWLYVMFLVCTGRNDSREALVAVVVFASTGLLFVVADRRPRSGDREGGLDFDGGGDGGGD